MSHQVTFDKKDPFVDAELSDDEGVRHMGLIHLRVQQRSGRKTLTTVQGISEDYDLKTIVKCLKKEFCCNGTVVNHKEHGEVIQLQGDHRNNVAEFLIRQGLCKKEQLKIHGF